VLLQREQELAEIERSIAAAAHGTGAVVLIEAPAGAGKTVLLQALRQPAAAAGMTVLAACGGELEQAAPWAIVRELLQPAISRLGAEERREILTGPAGPAAIVLSDRPAEEWSGPDQAFRIAHALTWLVTALARRAPLALLVDDVHWADPASLRWLAFLGRRLDDLSIVVVVAARPAEGEAQSAVASLVVGARAVRPSPLGLDAVARIVTERLGAVPAREFTAACHALTGGNPFLLGEILHEATADGLQPDERSAEQLGRLRPESVARAVLVRLARLERGALELARAVAVLGDAAAPGVAAALAGLPEAEALAAVDDLTRMHVFARDEELRFVHPLVRSAVYDDLTPVHRASAHRHAARLLADRGASPGAVVAQLLPAEAAAEQWAVDCLLGAAADARCRGAPESACKLARRALMEPPSSDRRAGALEELGRSELAAGSEASVAHLEAALAVAPGQRQRARIALRLSRAAILLGSPTSATRILTAALGRIDVDTGPALAGALQAELIGAALHDPTTLHIAREQLDAATARVASPFALDPPVLAALACVEVASGRDIDAGIAFARSALARRTPEADGYSSTLGYACAALRWAGRLEEACAAWDAEVEDARRLSAPLRLAWVASSRAQVLLRLGRVVAAEADARTAVELHDALSSRPVSAALAIHAEALLETASAAEARSTMARSTLGDGDADLAPHSEVLRVRARMRAEDGDHLNALSDLARIARLAARYDIKNPDVMPWRAQAALVHAATGGPAHGIRLADEEAELATAAGSRVALAAAFRARGQLRGQRGLEDLREAVGLLRGGNDRLEYVRSLVELGSAQRRAGDRAASRAPLREALDLAAAAGAAALADRARVELAASGARPRRDELRGRDALTASERRVALLACEGRTNRDIAQALFVSLRTVETHLTHAYQKLDVHARHELSSALE
jgi:DNA-binding CsgD family transcriptional regulator/tetratricopeptide (TPR) repeat protein